MPKTSLLALGLLAAVSSAEAHAVSILVEAADNATIQREGPRSGTNGKAFFNIEGASNGAFSSYGIARFDLGEAKSALDLQFGVGGWKLDSVSLALVQSNAAFSNGGTVGIGHSDNDGVDLQAGSSPLRYANLATDFSDLAALFEYSFAPIATGTGESHLLFQDGSSNGAGVAQLVADLMSDDMLTLLLVDLDAAVVATYAGVSHASLAGPTLAISASAVPVPAALPLLGAALGLLARRRRHAGAACA